LHGTAKRPCLNKSNCLPAQPPRPVRQCLEDRRKTSSRGMAQNLTVIGTMEVVEFAPPSLPPRHQLCWSRMARPGTAEKNPRVGTLVRRRKLAVYVVIHSVASLPRCTTRANSILTLGRRENRTGATNAEKHRQKATPLRLDHCSAGQPPHHDSIAPSL